MTPNNFARSIKVSNSFVFDKNVISNISNVKLVTGLWPLVYIILNKNLKEAYIGETTNAISRFNNHLTHSEHKKLDEIHLVTSDKFNKSATLDIESNLIKYISADGKFKLQNGNAGVAFHNYYQKDSYWEVFKKLWDLLIKKKISSKSLGQINNSDLFKFSPYKSLNEDQLKAIYDITRFLIINKSSTLFIEGSAGTGKTILAIFLFKLLVSNIDDFQLDPFDKENYFRSSLIFKLKNKFTDPKIALVVPMYSLRVTIRRVFKNIKGLNANMVISPSEVYKNKYDILIVDEAHRLRRRKNITNYASFDKVNKKLHLGKDGNELEWIIKQSKNQILFYDEHQSIKPSDIRFEDFKKLKKKSKILSLQSQLRVKGGGNYVKFVENLMDCNFRKNFQKFKSKDYEIILFNSIDSLLNKISSREKTHELCRLIAGFSWPWDRRKTSKSTIRIENKNLLWNTTPEDWINSANATKEVGCIHTTQGYDLNYAGVIFGNEISYDKKSDQIIIKPENYYDKKGKAGIKDNEVLKQYIVNIYKTLLLRGIYGTYVYVCDDELRKYFKKFISNSK
jgi:uncharacterized protein